MAQVAYAYAQHMRETIARRVGVLAALAIGLAACGAASAAPAGFSRSEATVRPPSCAATAPARIAANPWAPARARLAPAGARAIRLCRYDGLNAPRPRRLTHSTLIAGGATVAGLVRQFDRLPSGAGTYACPVDDGSEIIALLAYPRGRGVTISVGLRGCQTVSNGDVRRTAAGESGQPGPALVARLERMTS